MRKAFITGSTGFLGIEVLQALIKDTNIIDFFLLVRNKTKAEERLIDICKLANNFNKRIVFFEGDVCKENFGLSKKDLTDIQSVNEVYHLAAEVNLSKNKTEQVFSVNLGGIKNLLSIFRNVKTLEGMYYFSTAYINGRNKEELKEDWLDKKPVFRNPYEESKWLAEHELKSYLMTCNLPLVILRPTIIAMEDKNRFNEAVRQTIYLYGDVLRKAIKLGRNNDVVRLVGKDKPLMNIITNKEIIQILLKIRSSTKKERIYNIANNKNLSALSFLEGLKIALNFDGKFEFVEDLDVKTLSAAEKFIYECTFPYFEYNLDNFLVWNTTNTDKIRKELNIVQRDETWLKNHTKEFFEVIEYGK